MARQQPAPCGITEQRVADRLPEHRTPGAGPGVLQAVHDNGRAFEQQRQQQQRRHREKARPDHVAEHVDATRLLADHVAAGPAQCRAEHHQQTRRGGGGIGVQRNHEDAADSERQRQPLNRLHALAEARHRQPDREEHLRLDHQRRQTGRDVRADRQVQQPELTDADQQAVSGQIAPRGLRARYQQGGRQRGEQEAQRGEQQRWQLRQRQLDDDEVGAPHRHDGEGEQHVTKRQWTRHRLTVAQRLPGCRRAAARGCNDLSKLESSRCRSL